MDPISAFIADCDRVAEERGWKRSTISTLVLNDGKRLEQLAKGESRDIGVRRLKEARDKLARIERDTPPSMVAA